MVNISNTKSFICSSVCSFVQYGWMDGFWLSLEDTGMTKMEIKNVGKKEIKKYPVWGKTREKKPHLTVISVCSTNLPTEILTKKKCD